MAESKQRPVVYFFASRSTAGSEAFQRASALAPGAEWHLWQIETPDERTAFECREHHPDVIISFLNPYVVPSRLLNQTHGRAFNVHPALPDHPGRDPQHFAFYEGATSTGATLHRMDASVDSGEIIAVLEVPIDRALGVLSFIEQSERSSIDLLLNTVPAILDDSVSPATGLAWRPEAKTTRKQFLDMCRIDPDMTADEVARRIESFFNPSYRSVYVELHGFRFVYEPDT